MVDGQQAFLSGVCLSAKWLGNASKGIAPWRDTGIAIRGPAVAAMERAFVHSWAYTGEALPAIEQIDYPAVGNVALRVIATQPASAGTYRLDQLIAAMARKTLWLSDAYFVGVTPYVQGLAAAARDGVDVRLLVPGSSDIPAIAALSRAGYRPLLRAGVRVFEWNGSMMHAKTAVADDRWARVGSSNLNVASWLGNMELDVAIEDADFARQLADRYEEDLTHATEIILAPARYHPHAQRVQELDNPPKSRPRSGSSSRAAAGALRLANSVGAALSKHRVLSRGEQAPLLVGVAMLSLLALLGAFWPKVLAWPLAVVCAWFAFNLGMRVWRLHKRHSHKDDD